MPLKRLSLLAYFIAGILTHTMTAYSLVPFLVKMVVYGTNYVTITTYNKIILRTNLYNFLIDPRNLDWRDDTSKVAFANLRLSTPSVSFCFFNYLGIGF